MLLLSRKENESISIGPDITIHVISLGRNRVRLGIAAPKKMPIWRTEISGDYDWEKRTQRDTP